MNGYDRSALMDAAQAIASIITESNRRAQRPSGQRSSHDGYYVCCPAHPDLRPSLHIWILPQAQSRPGSGIRGIYLNCFGGCSWTGLSEALPSGALELLRQVRRGEAPGLPQRDSLPDEIPELPEGYRFDAQGTAWWPCPVAKSEAEARPNPKWRSLLRAGLQIEIREAGRVLYTTADVDQIWPYRVLNTGAGQDTDPTRVAGYKVRYRVHTDPPEKTYRCFSFWKNMHSPEVHLRKVSLMKPRPFYGNHKVLQNPPCWIFTEGEKSADQASRLFSPHAEGICAFHPHPPALQTAVTENDMAPLTAGKRPICVFPDLDKPGMQAAERWAEALRAATGQEVLLIDPETLPFHPKKKGADLGDCTPDCIPAVREWQRNLPEAHPLHLGPESQTSPGTGTL